MIRLLVCLLLSLLLPARLIGGVSITASGGWLETAFVEWSALPDADGYTVYQKSADAADSAYLKVPAELVRSTRVDIPGLPGGRSYDIKIIPTLGGNEKPDSAGVARIIPLTHDRSGFAFDKRSPRGALGTTGGYNPDGSINLEATVLYISEATKDSVSMSVTKGKKTTVATGLVAIQKARASAKSSTPLVIRFIGVVTPPADLAADPLKMLQLKDSGNVTYEGIGPEARLEGWGLDFQRCTNIEVRNLSFSGQPEDQISFQSDCLNLWIHHNDHHPGKGLSGGEKDKVLGDGALDVKSGSSWVTVSYNHYHGCQKTSGIGFGKDDDSLVMTFHHNFYDDCGSRMPRVSYVSAHVYNNYFKNSGTYCIAAVHRSSVLVEGNVFENCERPVLVASQGHDLHDGRSILSHNEGGTVRLKGNLMDGPSSDPAHFDPAVDASPGPALKGGAVYNNFETRFGSDYVYALDPPENAKSQVLLLAGSIRKRPN